MGVALSCIAIPFFLGKGTTPAKKKPICAEMMINTQAGLSYACLLKKMMHFTYVIVAVYFTTFESLTVSRNTRRPCYISKRAYSCHV